MEILFLGRIRKIMICMIRQIFLGPSNGLILLHMKEFQENFPLSSMADMLLVKAKLN
jgi:hypothetical protein